MCSPILGDDPTLYHNSMDFTYNCYQVTTNLCLLPFIVCHRASITISKSLLPADRYLDAEKPEKIPKNSDRAQIEEVEPRESSSARGNQHFRAPISRRALFKGVCKFNNFPG